MNDLRILAQFRGVMRNLYLMPSEICLLDIANYKLDKIPLRGVRTSCETEESKLVMKLFCYFSREI